MSTDEIWHLVEARRDSSVEQSGSALFRIRELEPSSALPKIFVVELPYKTSEMSTLPDATAYRRLSQFEEQWLRPACATLGWQFVAAKIEDGSTFLYCYGNGEPSSLLEKLAPFDGSLAFYDEEDPDWQEYAAIKELLDEAESLKQQQPADLEADVVSTPHVRKRAATVVEPPDGQLTQPIGKAKENAVTKQKAQAPDTAAMTPAERAHEAELFDDSGAPKLSAKAGAMKSPRKVGKAKAKPSKKAGALKAGKAKKSTAKKSTAKKSTAKKATAKKAAAKKAARKKSGSKKSGAKKRR
jgi:hypothetical protein